jgi:hypothetical protein
MTHEERLAQLQQRFNEALQPCIGQTDVTEQLLHVLGEEVRKVLDEVYPGVSWITAAQLQQLVTEPQWPAWLLTVPPDKLVPIRLHVGVIRPYAERRDCVRVVLEIEVVEDMRPREATPCTCDCHKNPNIMHFAPCCERCYEQF